MQLHGTLQCQILHHIFYIVAKPQPSMFKILAIMLLAMLKKVTYYAQYYAHNHCNYVTVHIQLLFLITRLA